MSKDSSTKFHQADRLFLDTVFIQALLNQRDDYHDKA
jgi:hypothetical protein